VRRAQRILQHAIRKTCSKASPWKKQLEFARPWVLSPASIRWRICRRPISTPRLRRAACQPGDGNSGGYISVQQGQGESIHANLKRAGRCLPGGWDGRSAISAIPLIWDLEKGRMERVHKVAVSLMKINSTQHRARTGLTVVLSAGGDAFGKFEFAARPSIPMTENTSASAAVALTNSAQRVNDIPTGLDSVPARRSHAHWWSKGFADRSFRQQSLQAYGQRNSVH